MTLTILKTVPCDNEYGEITIEITRDYDYDIWLQFKLGHMPSKEEIAFARKLVDEENIPTLLDEWNEEADFMNFIIKEIEEGE